MPFSPIVEANQPKWRRLFLVALFNLVVVAFLGLLLRYLFVAPVPEINYKYLLHAHSHVALLGWLYSAVFIGLLVAFLPPELRDQKIYVWQFWLSQAAVAGMLVTFPVQGYAAASITFSTAHILLSYWFIYQFLKDARQAQVQNGPYRLAFAFVRAALLFLALSSLGPWAMGPIMATGRSGSELYFNAIYFYLHLQYNGWFTFAVLGLFFWSLVKSGFAVKVKLGRLFFRLMFWSCLPAYLLSVLWVKPDAWLYWVSGAAALMQVLALLVFLRMVWPLRAKVLALFGKWGRFLLLFAVAAFVLKTLMQFSTAFPYMADLAYQQRFFIIGYLHLVLIGCISFFLFALFSKLGFLRFHSKLSQWGIGLFVFAFVTTEALLFLQGSMFWLSLGAIPNFHQWMFGFSVLLPVGILLFFIAQFRREAVWEVEKQASVSGQFSQKQAGNGSRFSP